MNKAEAIAMLEAARKAGVVVAVGAALSKTRALQLPTGDNRAALIEFENGANGVLGTTIKTPFCWRIALFGENWWTESVTENRRIVRRAGKEAEVFYYPAENHLGMNLDIFAKAAMGQGTFHISPNGILQTVAVLEAVFKSVEADGAWMTV